MRALVISDTHFGAWTGRDLLRDASAGLLALIAEKLLGKRFVFLAGSHDHHLVHRHGTHAQQNVFATARRAGRVAAAAGAPVRGARRLAAEVRERTGGGDDGTLPSTAHFEAVVHEEAARQAREQPLPGAPPARPQYPEPTVLSRSSPIERALEAFSQVVANLGWDQEADRVDFAHTHELLADLNLLAGGPGLPQAPA